MSDEEKSIYEQGADQYEQLISREDYQANLLPAIQNVLPLDNLRVVDLGTGTGRLLRLLASHLAGIIGLDTSMPMLKVARHELLRAEQTDWLLGLADHRRLPLAFHSVDLLVSGWSICYLAVWQPDTWRVELELALAEMRRVLRPQGTILLLETLGTGRSSPKPPAQLEAYFAWLDEKGFAHIWLRTDYYFHSRLEADELTHFFFGDEMRSRLIDGPMGVTLPECTGLWWL
jgi:ubiquinone/menaquinone biosynthesis C-methylase UbiE